MGQRLFIVIFGGVVLIVGGVFSLIAYRSLRENAEIPIEKRERGWYVQVGDKHFGPYDSVVVEKLDFKPPNFAFVFVKDGKEYVQTRDTVFGPYEDVKVVRVFHSASEARFAFVFRKGGEEYVRIDTSLLFGPYEEINLPVGWTLHRRSHKYKFVFREKGKLYVNRGGRVEPISPEEVDDELGLWIRIDLNTPKIGVGKDTSQEEVLAEYEGKIKVVLGEDGKRYVHMPEGTYEVEHFRSFGLREGSHVFAIVFRKGDGKYVWMNGKTFGPFEDVKPLSKDLSPFIFKRKGKWYLSLKGKVLGPYESVDISNAIIPDYGWSSPLTFVFKRDGKYYVQFNDWTFGPYDWARFIDVMDTTPVFIFRRGGKEYLRIGSRTLGPYDGIDTQNLFVKDTLYAFVFKRGKRAYINANGKILGPYKKARIVEIPYGNISLKSEGDMKEYFVLKFKGDGKEYLQIEGRVLGPYDSVNTEDLTIRYCHFAFVFRRRGKTYVQTDDGTFGPYGDVGMLRLEDTIPVFVFKRGGREYSQIGRKTLGPYDEVRYVNVHGSGFLVVYKILR